MHARKRGGGLRGILVMAAFLAGCAAFPYAGGEGPGAVTAFRVADTLFAHARYEDAIRAYREFIASYPTSAYADDAYLRIAHVYLYRPDSLRGWPGWPEANYAVARDTLLALIARYPATDRRLEAENWVKLLDSVTRCVDARREAGDSVASSLSKGGGSRAARLTAERNALRRRLRRSEAARDSLANVIAGLRDEKTALESELGRVRKETERMRRMLIDLERRREGAR